MFSVPHEKIVPEDVEGGKCNPYDSIIASQIVCRRFAWAVSLEFLNANVHLGDVYVWSSVKRPWCESIAESMTALMGGDVVGRIVVKG